MSAIINGDSPSVTFSDGTTQSTAFKAGAVTQSYLATGVAGTGPAFSAYANAATSLSNGAYTKVLFQVSEFDTNSNFASSRFTPAVAGYYQINASVATGNYGVGQALITVYKNGSRIRNGQNAAVNNIYNLNISTLVYLNGSTDYVEIYVYQASGGALNTDSSSSTNTWFTGVMVRSA